MRYITNNTSIPVPKVQQVWRQDEVTYITMDIVDGTELACAWHDMSDKTKRWVVEQLKGYLGQLRALKPPIDGAVMSVTGGPMRDISRVGLETFGPFQSHDDFHQFLRGGRAGIPMEVFENMRGIEKVVDSHRQHYATKFTHGDFAPRNIMVKRDGTITAIVDWDSAGWFPEYWEYTKAMFNPYAPDDWVESIGEMTGRYDEQLAGERQLYEVCGHELT
jgi:aminoglycoside phosphotransferase